MQVLEIRKAAAMKIVVVGEVIKAQKIITVEV